MADDTIARARSLLTPMSRSASPYSVLAAAALAATAAVLMAGVMILGPGISFEEPAPIAVWQ